MVFSVLTSALLAVIPSDASMYTSVRPSHDGGGSKILLHLQHDGRIVIATVVDSHKFFFNVSVAL